MTFLENFCTYAWKFLIFNLLLRALLSMKRRMKRIKKIIISAVLLLGCVFFSSAERRPIIGISDTHKDGTNAAVPRSYIDAVLMTGGIPVVIPLMYDDDEIITLINSLDGIIFTGGEDFDPAYYNERPIPQMGTVNAPRDRFDLKLLRLTAERGVPILGICRGVQLINIAFGGTLYQDLQAQYSDKSIRHRQRQSNTEASHAVIVEDYTNFANIVKERMLMVNSAHHQAIKEVAKGFRIAGRSADKIVEVIEKIDDENWILGVQFHPEMRVTRDNAMRLIFQHFMEVAGSQDKPERTVRVASASRSTVREPELTSTPQIIYKSAVDTQYVYKIIRDTQYVYMPSSDKQIIRKSDTTYLSAANSTTTPTSTVSKPVRTAEKPADTLVYTPLEAATSVTKKSDASKSEIKKERNEAEEKEKQRRKELAESEKLKSKQKKDEAKKQKEKEKFEKKFTKEKAKLLKQEQKEKAKKDKEALKAKEKQEKEEQKKSKG